ncbi:MAG: GTP 3',8-cyclase MoaA [Myxococcota bacterium]
MDDTLHAQPSSPRPAPRAARDTRGRALRDLRISVTDRCNFRCPYCMPAEVFGDAYAFLPRREILTFEEIERVVRAFVAQGVSKLRITGGEPLLRQDLPDLVARLARLPGVEDIALTTNGTLLPRLAAPLARAGLRRVTVSLDALDDATFRRMNGDRLSVERVLEGIEAAERAGLAPIKVNAVVQRGVNDDGIVALARHFRGTGHILRFIEYMDVGTRNAWDRDQVVSVREIVERLDAAFGLEALDANYDGEVARRWRYRDGAGEIGVIASVTQPFCGGCTRARLTTDGKLVTCLFGTAGADLRALLRGGASDAALEERIARVWTARADAYSEHRAHAAPGPRSPRERIEMYQVGG